MNDLGPANSLNPAITKILMVLLVVLGCAITAQAQTYQYLPGDVNMAYGLWPPATIGSDVTFLVNYFRGIPDAIPCYMGSFWGSADINGDCNVLGSDVTRLVNYFRGTISLSYCAQYPPAWLSGEDLPENAPQGWPNCLEVEDHPPILAAIGPQEISEGSTLSIRVTATDEDNQPITLFAEQLPSNAAFADSAGGVGGFVFSPDYDQEGIYQVRFIARSTDLADSELVRITVINTNLPPILEEIGPKIVVVNNTLQFRASASDPDGTAPSMTANGLPTEASYTDNGDGTADFTWQPGSGDIGVQHVTFIASDGGLADSEVVAITVSDSSLQGVIADHTLTGLWEDIPTATINDIMANNYIYYAHTSHGSQLLSGMGPVHNADERFPGANLIFHETEDDLGSDGDTSWAGPTRTYLAAHPECNVVMYSWCGGVSITDENGINIYLNKMTELENQYPDIRFVYMTGHLDGTGPDGNLYQRNNQIRQYCIANDKILFDFADIESYDPDGNWYPNESDACNWCYDWCDNPDNYCPDATCYCAHSHCFNCFRKTQTWWVMMALLEGWSGN